MGPGLWGGRPDARWSRTLVPLPFQKALGGRAWANLLGPLGEHAGAGRGWTGAAGRRLWVCLAGRGRLGSVPSSPGPVAWQSLWPHPPNPLQWVLAFEIFIPLVLFFILLGLRQKKPTISVKEGEGLRGGWAQGTSGWVGG